MPSRLAVAALATLAPLALAACDKQNPYITMTAGGVVVKARAVRYCRGDDCRVTTDRPTLKIKSGDTLGIDVPRSVAEDGWKLKVNDNEGEVTHDHYRAEAIGNVRPGGDPIEVTILREGDDFGEWQFTLVAEA
ncbi:MAG TPA: DUF2771 family protein [Solirubrobacteraceae bacterium]|jgi:hypothetical protein|nr:DUF2771 family protein [Solirubrobacteraceae bacterium]